MGPRRASPTSFRALVRESSRTLHPTPIEARSPSCGAARAVDSCGLETHPCPRAVPFKSSTSLARVRCDRARGRGRVALRGNSIPCGARAGVQSRRRAAGPSAHDRSGPAFEDAALRAIGSSSVHRGSRWTTGSPARLLTRARTSPARTRCLARGWCRRRDRSCGRGC